MMELVDTHSHIHDPSYNWKGLNTPQNAINAGVTKMICVGTSATDSQTAIDFAAQNDGVWASVGLHPHLASQWQTDIKLLKELATEPKVVAIGECGLDYYNNRISKTEQINALKAQIDLAVKLNLPLIFHVRDAYDDFWPIIDNYSGLKGVFHCFSANAVTAAEATKRGFYIGLNGIMTFSKDQNQLQAAKSIPLDNLLLETDAPFLTPTPLRGTINEPKNVAVIARFLSGLRGETVDDLAMATTANAAKLFGI